MSDRSIDEMNLGWKPGDPVGYIRDVIPDFKIPPYGGERYRRLVPDTLDLQDRAALAVNALTRSTDPMADYEMYMWINLKSNPPSMLHDFGDHCQIKFMEALPLMRIISGSGQNQQVDGRWMEVTLRQQGPDGLAYMPVRGRPWAFLNARAVPDYVSRDVEQFVDPVWCGRLLSSMVLHHLRDRDSVWANAATRLVDGLADIAVDMDRYAYFSPCTWLAQRGSTDDYYRQRSPLRTQASSRITLGLVHVYRHLGYEPAKELAAKLIRYALARALSDPELLSKLNHKAREQYLDELVFSG